MFLSASNYHHSDGSDSDTDLDSSVSTPVKSAIPLPPPPLCNDDPVAVAPPTPSPPSPPSPSTSAAPPNPPTPISLLQKSHLLTLACTHNRVDIITELLSDLPEDLKENLLNPDKEKNPWSTFTTPTILNPETSEEISTTPPSPPLTTAILSSSIESCTALLSLNADPRPSYYEAKKNDQIIKQSWGGAIIRIIGSDDVAKFSTFFGDSGMGVDDFLKIIKPTGNGNYGDCEDFLRVMNADLCSKRFKELFKINGKMVKRDNEQFNRLHELMLLESTLQTTLDDSLTELSIISGLIESGSKGLIENVRIVKEEIYYNKRVAEQEMKVLEGLVDRFEGWMGVEGFGGELDEEVKNRLWNFRYSVVGDDGEIVFLDSNENFVKEKVDNLIRRQTLSSSSNNSDAPPSIDEIISNLLQTTSKTIESLQAEIAATSDDLNAFTSDLDRTGLTAVLKHYRTLREEGRRGSEMNEVMRIHQGRVERELECLEAGVYRKKIIQNSGFELGEEQMVSNITEIVEASEEMKERINSSPHPDSIWGIILRLFLGFDYDDERAPRVGGTGVMIV
ncbi:hypothetical protein TrLO_g488 [Triparma laevis f. longispina]|uniref:Uncharacterized protein n=1 Tax=Triparma laevis f. longispina TaxID=1714387 RepID=A0A9W7C1N0_9STRA|nr:hypothetical protein TrLO_g488 [Triparma laevis f. longispina]